MNPDIHNVDSRPKRYTIRSSINNPNDMIVSKDLLISLVLKDKSLLKFISNNKDFMIALVLKDSSYLQHASDDLKDNEEVVLAAVIKSESTNSWKSFSFASERLRNDPGMAMAAIAKDYRALQYASDEIKDNKDFIITLIKDGYSYILQFASERLRNDKEVVIEAVKQPAHLPDSMPLWAAKCFSVLEDIRAHHEQVHKLSGLHGIFDKPQKLFGWAGAETYLLKLTASHTFPCDLGTIRQRLLDSGTSGAFYTSHHSFAADVRRVFHNAMVFNQNPEVLISKMASTLAKRFETSYERIFKKEIEDESARQQQREIKLKEQTENLKRRETAEKTAKRVEKAEAKLVVSQKMKERAALKRVITAQKLEQKKKLNKRKKARAIKRTAELENERLRQELESMRRAMVKQTEQLEQQRKAKRRKKST